MTKATNLKLHRLFESTKQGIVRREKPIQLVTVQKAGNCKFCGKPVMASYGQLLSFEVGRNGEHIYSHKSCRK